ncbi:hypothetical protein C9374_002747 [Naegleria lovaniensis]|uniref:VPS9 domain-containing protein n=1 Tax=Naegleria lovaniensis TaxID=51637 RepID=A0AA88GUZ7_NAELO|nr:uncharacterized protein C9374_002747 [Naegleria lovaniensis]KAG2386301.1 hypothetical protein C9374_002747 [Naegleria lovaniensis]
MPSNFFEYEKQNNRLVRTLRENKQFASIVKTIIDNDAVLLFPHDQSVASCLSNIKNHSLFSKPSSTSNSATTPNIDFMQSHIAFVNQHNPHQFITMNGIRGIFTEDFGAIQILQGPPTGEECISFFQEPKSLFTYKNSETGKCCFDPPYDVKAKIQILRKGEVNLEENIMSPPSQPASNTSNYWIVGSPEIQKDKTLHLEEKSMNLDSVQVKLYLISNPITYAGCSWTDDEKLSSHNGNEKKFTRSYSMVFDDSENDFVSVDKNNSPLGSPQTRSIDIPSKKPGSGLSNSVPTYSSSMEDHFMTDNVELPADESESLFIKTANMKNKNHANNTLASPRNVNTNNKINQLIDSHNGNSNDLFQKKSDPTETTSAFNAEKKDYKFDFKAFLQKLKDKSVVQLTRKIKSFTFEISNKEYNPNTPKIVQTFLTDIMREISQHEQWKNATEQDLMNAREGIEKYVMTKIFSKVFSPTLEDIEIDNQVASRISMFKRVITPKNLDITPKLVEDALFVKAVEELKKITFYKTPRDKLICVSNCCHLTMNLLKKVMQELDAPGADDFVPLLIFIVLRSNVPHLHSNIKYIQEYRNPQSLEGHTGYFLTSLELAMAFWLSCDHTQLNMDESTFQQVINFEDVFGKAISTTEEHEKRDRNVKTVDNVTTQQEENALRAPNMIEGGASSQNHNAESSVDNAVHDKEKKEVEKSFADTQENTIIPVSSSDTATTAQPSPFNNESASSTELKAEFVPNSKQEIVNSSDLPTEDQAKVVESSIHAEDKWEHLVYFVNNTNLPKLNFEKVQVQDLCIRDLEHLMNEYKKLASIYNFIKNQMSNSNNE